MPPGNPRERNYRGGVEYVELRNFCQRLRRDSTDAEQLLWSIVRGRQLAGAKFRRRHQFGPFILDFYCAEHRLAIEVDGGQHTTEVGEERDATRSGYLERHGVRVLRFDNLQVLAELEGVACAILEALTQAE